MQLHGGEKEGGKFQIQRAEEPKLFTSASMGWPALHMGQSRLSKLA